MVSKLSEEGMAFVLSCLERDTEGYESYTSDEDGENAMDVSEDTQSHLQRAMNEANHGISETSNVENVREARVKLQTVVHATVKSQSEQNNAAPFANVSNGVLNNTVPVIHPISHGHLQGLGVSRATSVASTRMRVTFTKEDDNLILKAVEQFGQKWAKIAKLPGLELHSADSIRGRYRDFLDPSLKTVEWTKSEDESLVIAHGQYGSKWTTIARQLPGRSRAAVRKRFLEIPQVKRDAILSSVSIQGMDVRVITDSGAVMSSRDAVRSSTSTSTANNAVVVSAPKNKVAPSKDSSKDE